MDLKDGFEINVLKSYQHDDLRHVFLLLLVCQIISNLPHKRMVYVIKNLCVGLQTNLLTREYIMQKFRIKARVVNSQLETPFPLQKGCGGLGFRNFPKKGGGVGPRGRGVQIFLIKRKGQFKWGVVLKKGIPNHLFSY